MDSFTDPGGTDGWVSLVSWPISDSLPTKLSPVNDRSVQGKSTGQGPMSIHWQSRTSPSAVPLNRELWSHKTQRKTTPIQYRGVHGKVISAKPLGRGVEPTGDRSYPPWNHLPPPGDTGTELPAVDSRPTLRIISNIGPTSHIILMKVRSKTLSPLWHKSIDTFFGGSAHTQVPCPNWRESRRAQVMQF